MDIGLLNLRIQIQKNAVISDAIGNRKNTWTDYFSCYATIGGESGTEVYRAGETLESADLTFTVRYSVRQRQSRLPDTALCMAANCITSLRSITRTISGRV